MKTKQLAADAVLAAMCAVLGAVSLDFGNLKISFESLPVLMAALMFGPLDGLAVGGIGTLIYQVLRYGVTVTTLLWCLPYALCGVLAGWYAREKGFVLSRRQLAIAVFSACILIFVLNTAVMYVDSIVYSYYSFVYIFGSIVPRILICFVKAAAFTAVLPSLMRATEHALR